MVLDVLRLQSYLYGCTQCAKVCMNEEPNWHREGPGLQWAARAGYFYKFKGHGSVFDSRLLGFIKHQLRQEIKCKSGFGISWGPNDVWFYDFKFRAFAVTQLIISIVASPVVSLSCVSIYRSLAYLCRSFQNVTGYSSYCKICQYQMIL